MRLFPAAVLVFASLPVHATPWHSFGPRAMGMGGAQVAIAQGPLAAYWNPAGLAQLHNEQGFVSVGSVRGEFAGQVIQGANDLNQLASDCRANPGGPTCTQANINAALSRFGQSGNGALADLGLGASFNLGRAVVFVNDFAYIGGTPRINYANTTPATVQNNQSSLVLRGGSFTEIGLGYGHEIGQSGAMVGGNLKGIIGRVGYHPILLATEDPGAGKLGDFTKSARTSFQPGIDLGALWDVRETFPGAWWRPRLGVVARNINNPRFNQPEAALAAGDRAKFSLHGQYRAGAAISPLTWWHLAGDLDLSRNVTNVDGFASRYVSAGTEIDVFNGERLNVPLRFGIQKNVADAGSGVSWTAGFGLHLLHATFDLGAMISSRRVYLQSQGESKKMPENVALAAQFGVQFGGVDLGPRNHE